MEVTKIMTIGGTEWYVGANVSERCAGRGSGWYAGEM